MHPYRHRSRATSRVDDAGARALARARRAVFAAALPLVVLAALFFAPLRGGDYGFTPRSLVEYGSYSRAVANALYLVPPYLAAAMLAALIVAAALAHRARRARPTPRREAAGDRARRSARVVVTMSAASPIGLTLLLFPVTGGESVLWGPVGATAAAAIVLLWRSRRARGWRRWGFLLALYTVFTSPMSALYALTVAENRAGWGVYAWAVTVGSLWVLSLIAIWPARRSTDAQVG